MKKVLFLILSFLILITTTTTVFSDTSVALTQTEKDYIKEHPVIYLGVDPNFVPYEFIDIDNSYNGIAKDYLDLISQKTGLKFEVTLNLTWDQAYEKVVLKELDVLPIIGKSDEREKYFLFTDSYYSFQRVMFVSTTTNITSLDDLVGKSVSVQKNSSHHEFLKAYPLIKLNLYNTVEEAIAALNDGREEVFIGNLVTTLYLGKKAGYTQLKYVYIPSQNEQSLHMAVRNDSPILVDILNKGIAAITTSEKIAIDNRWVGAVESKDYAWLIQIVVGIVLIGVIVILVSLYWVFRLKKEIDHRKIVELDLKDAKEDADRANQVKSSFLARMSHEIRTPLNAVTGMSYILKKSGLTLTQQSYLDKITAASKDVIEIINDILDFSKIESGKVSLEVISFNLDEVLEHLITIVLFKVEEQGIDLKIEKDPFVPLYFYGDPKRLQQILLNLLNNSVKFTKKGSVTLKINSLGIVDDKRCLEIAIEDTGIGMTNEQIEGLFTPFTQADDSITRRFGGTGLGLSIVKSLLELMGGTIEVTSELAVGSCFKITLALTEDKKRNTELKHLAAKLYLSDIKTMILDKQPAHAQMIQDYLKAFNLATDLFFDAQLAKEALEDSIMKDRPYNLLILDYDTPLNNGLEFSVELNKTEWIQQHLKIILMIPFNSINVFDQLDQASVDLGINKPIIPSVLFNGIIDLFRQDVTQKLNLNKKNDEQKGFEVAYPYAVLLCEDNKTNQFIAKSLLEQAGYTIKIVDNGQLGVDEYKQHPDQYDIILMDLHMPIKNGYEAAQEIRALNSTIPIVAMTADAIAGVEQKCKEAGITHYITKPFDPESLAMNVFNLIINKKEVVSDRVNVDKYHIEPNNLLDKNAGLRNVGGNEELYKNILAIFASENQKTSEALQIAIANSNFEKAIQIVHKIKGSCGTIGGIALHQQAIALQKALHEKDIKSIELLHLEFSSILNLLLEEIALISK